MWWDKKENDWVRTGKADCIKTRDVQHEKTIKSDAPFDASNIAYVRYMETWDDVVNRRVSFCWTQDKSADVIKVFHWPSKVMAGLERSKYPTAGATLGRRQTIMVSYLAEHVLDLSLDIKKRVSSGVGFESFLGVHCK